MAQWLAHPSAVASSIPAISMCHFYVVPTRVPGGEADEKTGPVLAYG